MIRVVWEDVFLKQMGKDRGSPNGIFIITLGLVGFLQLF